MRMQVTGTLDDFRRIKRDADVLECAILDAEWARGNLEKVCSGPDFRCKKLHPKDGDNAPRTIIATLETDEDVDIEERTKWVAFLRTNGFGMVA